MSSAPLPRALLVSYGLPMGGYLAMSLPVGMWLMKHATDTLLIAPAAMGAIFAAARVWDAISDPLAGYLSDRTRSRLGRRRSWLVYSVVPLAITYVMLWSPPSVLEGVWLVAWVFAAMLLWETASTAFYIPYSALGIELSNDYHERTRLFAWRQMLTTLGYGVSLGLLYVLRTAEAPRQAALTTSASTGIALALLILVCAARTPEPVSHVDRGGTGLWASFRDVARNPHALRLFVVYGVDAFGLGIVATLAPYLLDDVVGRVDLLETFLACWMVPQFLLVPLWIRASRRFGKKSLWLGAMAIVSVGFGAQYFAGEDSVGLVIACVIAIGIGSSVSSVIGPSMQADCVDYDEWISGERKEGAYAAIWNFIRKAGSAGAAAIGGLALSLGGYDATAELQNETTRQAIRLTAAILPALLFGLGLLALSGFSLNEQEHAEIGARLRERRSD